MKNISISKKKSLLMWFNNKLTIKNLVLGALIITSIQSPLQAQETSDVQKVKYTQPTWRFGAAAGANFNFHRGTTQELNLDAFAPTAFHNGYGVGLFALPVLEFHPAGSILGFSLYAGYDSRKGSFEQKISPCNCPEDLTTNLAYITVEPSVRLNIFDSPLYIFAGPRLAINVNDQFNYDMGINPEYPEQVDPPAIDGTFSYMNKTLISMQIGAGYDFALTADTKQTQVILAPFVSYQPYFGQDPRSIESWNLTTFRAGFALKFGKGQVIPAEKIVPPVLPVAEIETVVVPEVAFNITSPENIPLERRVRETFPIRNYIFFNLGSTEIPERYVLLKKSQVKDFKETQLEVFTPKKLTGRSDREMIAYYNILNILGDRMSKNPSTKIKLVGSSENTQQEGEIMAESVKKYLVDIFDIDPNRITTKGNTRPEIPSHKLGGILELDLLNQDDRRVTVETNSPELLMEFQSGEAAPLKPVVIDVVQEAPLDSYISIDAAGANDSFSSWSLKITDEKGIAQNFGPYNQEQVSIPGKSILGKRAEGDYKFTIIGTTQSGDTVKKETQHHLVLWTPPTNEQGMRFSVIYEFNNSKSSKMYEKYLSKVVTPQIPKNASVIIHGHTDAIGDPNNNKILSLARANDVKGIIETEIKKQGRTDVNFEINGFGEDVTLAPFGNKLPEERFYNRTVIIDIIPEK